MVKNCCNFSKAPISFVSNLNSPVGIMSLRDFFLSRTFLFRGISFRDLQAPSNSEPPSIFRTSLAESDCFSAPKPESEPEPQLPLREDVIFPCD